MKDLKNIAHAILAGVPEADIARTLTPLEALEKAFRPLAAALAPTVETTVIYTKSLEDCAE